MSAVSSGSAKTVVHAFPSSIPTNTSQPQLSEEIMAKVHAVSPIISAQAKATSSAQTDGKTNTAATNTTTSNIKLLNGLTLHVHVDRSPFKAWADAWTTVSDDPNSQRVNAGSIRLLLEWASKEDSTVNNTSEHHQWEWATFGAFTKAKATAWSTNPNLGPVSAETSV